ncbi:MAG TPA: DOMON-like domain-containing protein [Sphingobium sp.]|nr:DOMON-like domain-containing protein [Sphingobium sp.]
MSSILAERPLLCHPETPCAALIALGVRIASAADGGWDVEFVAVGRPDALRLPGPAPAVQTEGLWRTTCFELFLAQPEGGYVELNLSPSGAFAAYHFDHYRTGMRPLPMPAPAMALKLAHERLTLHARLAEDDLPWDRTGRLGVSAVIEDQDGAVSYWALAHPPGRPDFHHHDCFALVLPSGNGA